MFKPCGERYNQISCRKLNSQNLVSASLSWTKIVCPANPCTATLLITNPIEDDSGLYRCSIQPYRPNNKTTLQIQVVKTYQLDVISNIKKSLNF